MYAPVRRRVPLRRTSGSRLSTTAHIRERDSYRVWRRRMRRERRLLMYLQAFYEGACSQVRRAFEWLVLRPLAAIVHVFYLIFLSPQSHRILIRASLFCALHLTCITAALIAYVSFYRVWVPDMTITKDVALQYTPPTSKPMIPFLDEKSTPPHAYIHLDHLDVDFPTWCTGDTTSSFREDQEYNIALEITVPVNTENTHLGNTMVDLALLAKEGQELYVSKRPMLLVPEPVSVRWMFRAWRMAMLPHSAQPIAAMQQVKVPLLRRVVPRPSRAGARSLARDYHGIAPSDSVARYARIQFSKEVQTLGATLRFDAQMHGIPYVRHIKTSPLTRSYYMANYPTISLVLFLVLFASVEMSVAGAIWLYTVLSLDHSEAPRCNASRHLSAMRQSLPPETLTGRIQLAFELAADRGAEQSPDADVRALNALAQAAQLAGAAGVISDNDTLHEVSTRSLRVLLIPSLQAELEASARPTSTGDRSRQRRNHLQASIGAARNFVTMLTRLRAMPPALLRVLQQRIVASETPEAARRGMSPADQRQLKIQLFKLERAVRAHQDAFRTAYRERARARTAAIRAQTSGTAQGEPADVRPINDAFYDVLIVGEADDEDDGDGDEDDGTEEALQGANGAMYEPRRPQTLRGYLLQLLVLHMVHIIGVVDSAAQELAILAMEPSASAPEPAPPADATWRLDSGWCSGERGGPLLSEQGKPLRPFTITPSTSAQAPGATRRRMQGEVFRPSHRLPTMSIDEYLEEERRRGNIIDGGGPAQAAQATPKEQRAERAEMDGTWEAEEAEEEARQEAMHWDEFRDSHRRGEGNRMNRG